MLCSVVDIGVVDAAVVVGNGDGVGDGAGVGPPSPPPPSRVV